MSLSRSEVGAVKRDSAAQRILVFAFLTVFLDLAGFGIIIPLLPLYVKSMRGSAETVGFILSSFSATQLLATPLLGRLSDRVGRRPVILLSLGGNALAMALFALATRLSLLPLLFASRILAGATSGNIAACQAAIADVTSAQDRARGMGRLGAGIGLGMVVGPVLGSAVSGFGAWAPPVLAGVLALLDLAGAFFFMRETNPSRLALSRTRSGMRLGEIFAQRALVLVLLLFFLTFLYLSTLNVALPLLANLRLSWGEREIGHVFGLFGLVMLVIQGGLIGRMTKLWEPRRIVVGGAVASTLGLFLVAYAKAPVPLVCGLAMFAVGLGLITPCLSTIASDQAGPDRQGAVLGVAQSAGGLARTIGPTALGVIYARIGPGAPFVTGALAALVSVLLALALPPNTERDLSG